MYQEAALQAGKIPGNPKVWGARNWIKEWSISIREGWVKIIREQVPTLEGGLYGVLRR